MNIDQIVVGQIHQEPYRMKHDLCHTHIHTAFRFMEQNVW